MTLNTTSDIIRVLHVDDEPDFADMAATFIEREDERFTIEIATSADEGLDRLRDDEFDCIISDYDMPGQNGIEFLETVREDYPELPFILYTGKGSEEVASEAISSGVTDYLQKESGTSQYNILAHRIRNVVDQNRSRQAVEETEQKLSQLAERSDDILFMFNGDWSELLFLNSAFEDIWGIPVEQVEENPDVFIESIHPEDKDDARRSLERLSMGHPDEIEYRIVRPDGDQRWIRGQSKPIFDEEGNVTRIVGFVRDITDRKERERRFEAIFNNTYTFVGLLDPDGTLIEVNDTALSFGDLDRDDIIGKEMWEAYWFQHSEDTRERAHRAVERAADGEFVRHELSVQGADREAIIDFSVRPITDEQGNVTLLIPEGRDITERTERETRLRALNERTNHLGAADTREQISELAVEAASEVLGFDANAIHLYDDDQAGLVPVAGTDEIYDLIGDLPTFAEEDSIAWRVYENGKTLALDDVRDDPDIYNPETPIRSELYLPLGDHGILIAGSETPATFDQQDVVFGEILADIIATALDRITREQALKESEARYRSLTDDVLDTSNVGTFILNADFEIVWINEAIEEYFGIDRDAVVDADKRQLIHDHVRHTVEDSEGFATTVLATYDNNTYVEEFECHVVPADKRDERWLRHWSQPIESGLYEGGRIEHYTDITDRKRRERELTRQNERLEKFASIVSHDLRNPLRVAEGKLELARDECDSEYLDDIVYAHERMNTLIDDLLMLAQDGEPVGDTEPINLENLTKNCWRNVATAEATLTTDVEQTINADQSRLQQLLENLIQNAVEHGGENVTVTIGGLDDGFYVEDDGPGISENERDDVFEAGYSTAEEGTGFGLNIVEQVVDAHDWEIHVTEGSEGGARFEVTGVSNP